MAKKEVVAVRRDTGKKQAVKMEGLAASIQALLDTVQADMFARAKAERDSHVVKVHEWKDVVPTLNARNLILIPWCQGPKCEDAIKERSKKQVEAGADGEPVDEKAPSMGAKSLCIPFDQPTLPAGMCCIQCGQPANCYGLFGRSY